jgi:hypothetical protein
MQYRAQFVKVRRSRLREMGRQPFPLGFPLLLSLLCTLCTHGAQLVLVAAQIQAVQGSI